MKDFLPSKQALVANIIGAIIAAVIISKIPALRKLTKE